MGNLNNVAITGNLTRDPELRYPAGGTDVLCKLRVAVSCWHKDSESGEWAEKPSYLDVAVWGRQAETVAMYLVKGSGVAIASHLDWHEWTDAAGAHREAVEIFARTVEFLGPKERAQEMKV